MVYVFVFMGEFGYELLNWHGVVQKFRRLNPKARVIAASRSDVAALYPGAIYVDIAACAPFRDSVASGYAALRPGDEQPSSQANARFDAGLRAALRRHVLDELQRRDPVRARVLRLLRPRFVFSSGKTVLGECTFGAHPALFGNVPGEGDIYDLLDLTNNFYFRVAAPPAARAELERRTGVSLDAPYVLVQARTRAIRARSLATVDAAPVLSALARRTRVLFAEFATGRAADSYSAAPEHGAVVRVPVRSFAEQAALVEHARGCVFLTEGDFGSHIYVPPFLGRDVWSVAPREVYALDTAPLERWNRHVFRFGGQIRRVDAEDLQGAVLERFADEAAA